MNNNSGKHAHWIYQTLCDVETVDENDYEYNLSFETCSKCRKTVCFVEEEMHGDFLFCPYCGAKMDECENCDFPICIHHPSQIGTICYRHQCRQQRERSKP